MNEADLTKVALQSEGAALPPGHGLGRYRILAVIERTPTEMIYLAQDSELRRRVVLREFFPADLALRVDAAGMAAKDKSVQAEYQRSLKRFVDQVRALAGDGSSREQVHDFLQANGTAYAVTPIDERALRLVPVAPSLPYPSDAASAAPDPARAHSSRTPTAGGDVQKPSRQRLWLGLSVALLVGLAGGGYAAWSALDAERAATRRQLEAATEARIKAQQLADEQQRVVGELQARAEAERVAEQARQKAAEEARHAQARQAAQANAPRPPVAAAEPARLNAAEAEAYVTRNWPAIRRSAETWLRANLPATNNGVQQALQRIESYKVVEVSGSTVRLQIVYEIRRGADRIGGQTRTLAFRNEPPGFPATGL